MKTSSRIVMAAAALVAVTAGAPTVASAQSDQFDALVQDGMSHYRARRYDQAIEKFEAAYAVSPQPELIYNVARAYEKSLKRDEAMAAYERFLSLEGTTADLRSKALEALTALRREKEALRASERAKNRPSTELPPPTAAPEPNPGGVRRPAPEPRSRTLEWILIGGGAAAAATGAVFGVLALQANSEFDDLQSMGASRAELEDQKSKVDDNALAADVLIGVGAVSAIAGVILLLTGDDGGEEAVAVSPVIGRDYAAVGLGGRF